MRYHTPTAMADVTLRMPMKHVAIASTARTHPGRRAQNEDAVLARDDLGVWAVADGMGGHQGGSWASATVIETLARLASEAETGAAALDRAVTEGSREIVEAAKTLGGTIGTTFAGLSFDGFAMRGLWVGDSRIYRWRGGALERLTRDHSMVQELVDRGMLQPHEAEKHPMAHVLSRAVGVQAAVNADRFGAEALPGDMFLLCSDGLTRVVSEAEIGTELAHGNAQVATDTLLEMTLARGAPDNVSIVVVRITRAF